MTLHLLRRPALLIAALAAVAVSAQTPGSITDEINASGTISVSHPDALEQRIRPAVGAETAPADAKTKADSDDADETSNKVLMKTGGFRVQVFSDNNPRTAKAEAHSKAKAVAAAFPQYPTYVVYESTYWRLKVGDFRSHDEAEAAATEIKRAFPAYAREVRVKRDRINVNK